MSISTTLYRLPLSTLEAFDRAGVVNDTDLAALGPESYLMDQGISYPVSSHHDVFAYMFKAEGHIPQQHEEVWVGYVTPRKLKERLKDFEKLDASAILEDLPEEQLTAEYLNQQLEKLREYLRAAADQDQALMIVAS